MPILYYNFLSLGLLCEKGYDLRFRYGIGIISDDKLGLTAKLKMNRNHLWAFPLKCSDLLCFSSVTFDDNWLWYLCFGHLNFGSSKLLARKNLIVGLYFISFPKKQFDRWTIFYQFS